RRADGRVLGREPPPRRIDRKDRPRRVENRDPDRQGVERRLEELVREAERFLLLAHQLFTDAVSFGAGVLLLLRECAFELALPRMHEVFEGRAQEAEDLLLARGDRELLTHEVDVVAVAPRRARTHALGGEDLLDPAREHVFLEWLGNIIIRAAFQ